MQQLQPDINDTPVPDMVVPKHVAPYFRQAYETKANENETEAQFASRMLTDYIFMLFINEEAHKIREMKEQETVQAQQDLVDLINVLKAT